MKYVRVNDLQAYINGRKHSSISCTSSLRAMKLLHGWDKASEIIRSGNAVYALWE